MRLPSLVAIVFGALVFAGFPASLAFRSFDPPAPLPWWLAAVCVVAGGLAAASAILWGARAFSACRALLGLLAGRLWVALAAGLLLRLSWILLVQPTPASDGQSYLVLAQGLLAQGEFRAGSTRAYWPPGLAFVLLPFLAILPSPSAAIAAFGLVFFVVGALGTDRLARRLGLGSAASVAVAWLAALWPAYVMLCGLPSKELIVIALMPWALRYCCDALSSRLAAAAAGLLVGAMVLVQPSLQLLPLAAALAALIAGSPWRPVIAAAALAIVAMLAVLAPWTLRNHLVLGKPVLVSTNGGSNLYRANNELATGAYVANARVDVEALPELEADRVGKRLALEWIQARPMDFLRLCATRLLLFPGDQSGPAYAAFRSDPDRVHRLAYLTLKALAAFPWLLLWVVVVHRAASAFRGAVRAAPLPGLLLLPTAYLTVIHTVFESGPKYHLPTLLPMLVVLVVLTLGDTPNARGGR
jgi:hypothetical protein